MAECKFKVGETYKDRYGYEWTLVARNDEWSQPLVFRRKSTSHVVCRFIDGKCGNADADGDILPNKRKEWVVTCKHHGAESVSVFVSEHGANNTLETWLAVNRFNWEKGNPPPYTDIRGPFLWESED